MSLRRLLPLMMLALMMAPFGRMGSAEAKAMPHHQVAQTGSHCAGQPQPTNEADRDKMVIDCMIACAAVTAAADAFVIPLRAALDLPVPVPAPHHNGIRPEAEPPPPRLS